MKNKLYIETSIVEEKEIDYVPDFQKYLKSWIPVDNIKFGLAMVQRDKPMVSVGEELPAFKAYLIDGTEYDASEWKDYVKVYDFWGLWCPGCKMEIPVLNEIKKHFEGEKVKFIAFATDDIATLRHYKALKPFDYEIAYHADYVANKLGVYAYPHSFVVGKDNKLIYSKGKTLAEKFMEPEEFENEKQKFIESIEEALAK
jgi:thiol-disulfide isomerase/thioredoxin